MTYRGKKIVLVLYSLLLVVLWGNGLLSAKYAGFVPAVLVFAFTVVSVKLLFAKWLSDFWSKLLILAGPSFYFVLGFLVQDFSVFVVSPVTVIFPIMFSMVLIKNNHLVLLFSSLVFVGYSFFYYKPFHNKNNLVNKTEIEVNPNESLFIFRFVNSKFDTISLKLNENPTLIKTWNESCGPCINSFVQLQDTLAKFANLSVFYLYQSSTSTPVELENIFENKHIADSEKILVDVGNQFYEKMNLNGYPYFFIFDLDGNLHSYTRGYSSSKKNELIETWHNSINSLINKYFSREY